jgi:hypothetical protein
MGTDRFNQCIEHAPSAECGTQWIIDISILRADTTLTGLLAVRLSGRFLSAPQGLVRPECLLASWSWVLLEMSPLLQILNIPAQWSLAPIQSHNNPVQSASTSWSSWCFLLVFPTISYLHARQFHPPWLYHYNYTWRRVWYVNSPWNFLLTVAGLLFCSALSDERTGL